MEEKIIPKQNDESLASYIDSLNNIFKDISEHPIDVSKEDLPSNFEIICSGINGSSAMDLLFSTKLDKLLESMFSKIISGDYESIIENKDKIEALVETLFGKGSFKGPISNAVLGSIQSSVMSYKYQTMKSWLGKSMTTLKKIRLILRNLERNKKAFKDNKEQLQKYNEAVYAIKQVLKIARKIYANRQMVNNKVYNGIKNIIHEEEKV